MSRQTRIVSSEFPYHITARAHNKAAYPIAPDDVWRIVLDNLWLTHHLYNLRIRAFVLMPNHFHLLAETPDANLGQCLQYFMSQTGREINRAANTINQVHGSRYFSCLVESAHYFFHAYKYVYANPLKAGLCRGVEHYRYSSLRMLLGLAPMELPIEPDDLLMGDIDRTLRWLNRPPDKQRWDDVRRAMRGAEFTLFADPKTRRRNPLEYRRL